MEFIALLALGALIAFIFWAARDGEGQSRPSTRNATRKPDLKIVRKTQRQVRSAKKDLPVREGFGHAPPPPIPESRKLKGRAYIIDGDTIVVSKIKIRLAGIDAPELDQPWGQKSKWEMVRICKGQTISVELTGETSYDRLVGTCYLPDGRDIGAELIKAGLALDGGHYSKGKYRHLEPAGVRQRLKFYGHWRHK